MRGWIIYQFDLCPKEFDDIVPCKKNKVECPHEWMDFSCPTFVPKQANQKHVTRPIK
jgi:hypothetical protein